MQTLHNVTQQSIGRICRQGLMHASMQNTLTPVNSVIGSSRQAQSSL